MTDKKIINNVTFRYAIFFVLMFGIEFASSFLVNKLIPDFAQENAALTNLGMTVIDMYVIGFSLIFFLTRKLPNASIEKKTIKPGRYIAYILMTFGLVGMGALIGYPIHNAVSSMFSSSELALADIMLDSSIGLRALVVGIMAPVFEELIFRKLLVDKLAVYGERVAIIASGLLFGLFHANFMQGVFASFIGALFAYVYLRSGHIIYTIGLHAAINLTTSVGTVSLMGKYYEALNETGYNETYIASHPEALTEYPNLLKWSALMGLFLICLLIVVIVGAIVFLVNFFGKKLTPVLHEGQNPKQAKNLFASVGLYVAIIAIVPFFVMSYKPVDASASDQANEITISYLVCPSENPEADFENKEYEQFSKPNGMVEYYLNIK